MIAVETISGMALDEITRRRNAPAAEPSKVRTIKSGNRRRLTTGGRRNGKVPPRLINVNANMLVATATRESIPNWNIAGTVMIDVLPVITLTLLVAKKIAISASKRAPVTASILAFWQQRPGFRIGDGAGISQNGSSCKDLTSTRFAQTGASSERSKGVAGAL